jgi:glycosyltransferase involved in cell wall biosynthesis
MNKPEISIIMPVFNGEKYIAEAIDSILNQTFNNYEFIIIDDGSIDGTVDIVKKYDDPRIILTINESNLGLSKSLNKGIKLARGNYIARMDCDDISLPERLAKQINFLEKNPTISMVACRASLIDSIGNDLRMWLSESQTMEEIKAQLPKNNCIVHPSVMIRADVAKSYLYNEKMITSRRDYEDYELWLRLISDNNKIAKISESLIRHRVHAESFMGGTNSVHSRFNIIRTKKMYLSDRINKAKFSLIDYKISYYMIMDICYWAASPLIIGMKNMIKQTIVNFGKLISILSKYKNISSRIIFTSHSHDDKQGVINSLVSGDSSGEAVWIFCTNDKTKKDILSSQANRHIYNISSLTQYAIIKYIMIGILSSIINKKRKAIVIGLNSMFFYNLIMFLNEGVITIDLLAEFDGVIEEASLCAADRLNARITDNPETLSYFQAQYSFRNMNPRLKERIIISSNMREAISKIISNSGDPISINV